MRLKLNLQVLHPENRLPLNYAYEISAWIYKVINRSDHLFAEWLQSEVYP
ncbi:MAG: hypothetical protein WAN36_13740 [Calditrichia bacterium]